MASCSKSSQPGGLCVTDVSLGASIDVGGDADMDTTVQQDTTGGGSVTTKSMKRTRSLEGGVDVASFSLVTSKKKLKTVRKISTVKSTQLSSDSQIDLTADAQTVDSLCECASVCVFCGEGVEPTDSLSCDFCKHSYHLVCCQVDISKHTDILNLTSFFGWTCRACRFEAPSLITTLRQKIDDLSNELKSLRSSIPVALSLTGTGKNKLSSIVSSAAVASGPSGVSSTGVTGGVSLGGPNEIIASDISVSVMSTALHSSAVQSTVMDKKLLDEVRTIVSRTISQTDRRKNNLVIMGLPESDGSAGAVADSSSFAELVFAEMDIDISNNIISSNV